MLKGSAAGAVTGGWQYAVEWMRSANRCWDVCQGGVPAEVPDWASGRTILHMTAAGLHYARYRQRGEAQKMMRPPAATRGLANSVGMRYWFMQLMV